MRHRSWLFSAVLRISNAVQVTAGIRHEFALRNHPTRQTLGCDARGIQQCVVGTVCNVLQVDWRGNRRSSVRCVRAHRAGSVTSCSTQGRRAATCRAADCGRWSPTGRDLSAASTRVATEWRSSAG
jgi:hypothetical protein